MADKVTLPDDKEQFKLNEVCKLANVQPYMLRFWGTEFPQLEAEKTGTGQRLYSRDQVELILEIRSLLFDEGLTIAGARKKVEAMSEEAEAASKPKKAAKEKGTASASKTRTSTARRKKDEEVDKSPPENVQPLLATLKNVRDEIDKIVAELKSE